MGRTFAFPAVAGERCPRCGSYDVTRRERRGVGAVVAAAFLLRPFRCAHCERHFLAFASRPRPGPAGR
jgi:transposase-like protein